MQQLYDVLFASSNKNKFLEAKSILEKFDINLGFYKCNLLEIQSDKLENIAMAKIKNAFNLCKKPVIIEDDGIFIDSLNGFPGPYSSYVFQTIGNKGIIKLITTKRSASFQSIIAYYDSTHKTKLFKGKINGKISTQLKGKGWGYDPIFIPSGTSKTFAQINDKNIISHRFKALKKFANWFPNKQESIYQ